MRFENVHVASFSLVPGNSKTEWRKLADAKKSADAPQAKEAGRLVSASKREVLTLP